jgi:hypothetical protein
LNESMPASNCTLTAAITDLGHKHYTAFCFYKGPFF